MSDREILPEFALIAEPVSEDAKRLTYASWPVGTRHKLGGTPDLLQDEPWPACTECSEPTVFYGQLDSLADEDGRWDIADCGMIYVFFCFDCNAACTLVQSG